MPAPETEAFSIRGVIGSGMPYCIPSIDVSNYVYVNPMTLDQASSLYYNLYSVNIPAASLVYEIHITDNPDTDPPDETYDEVMDWTVISAPVPPDYEGDPVPPTVPFVEGIIQQEESGYRDVGSYDFDTYRYEPVEPKDRSCLPNRAFASRTKIAAYDQLTSVYAGINILPFSKLYDGVVTDEANHIGYGFSMGIIQMHCGIFGLEASGVAYGNYAEDGDWEIDPDPSNFFPYPNWWSQFGPYYGDWLTGSAIPDEVDDVEIDGIPFVQAQWTGREGNFGTNEFVDLTWKVTPLPTTDVFEFYTYP